MAKPVHRLQSLHGIQLSMHATKKKQNAILYNRNCIRALRQAGTHCLCHVVKYQ